MKASIFSILTLLSILHLGCAFDIATKEEVQQVQGNLQARQMNLSEEVLELKRNVGQFQGELDEASTRSKSLQEGTTSNLRVLASKIESLDQRLSNLEQGISRLQSQWSKTESELRKSLQSRTEEMEARQASSISKMEEKLNIILDEVSKENERIMSEIRSLKRQGPSSFIGNFHIVQTGESLSKIAAQYGIGVEALAQANGITNPNTVRAGQKLTIPKRQS